ncbi:MAG: TolC family protein [Gemmatimonadaceae bacterium]|nr:TolC family protein [Gemmatimonadaceae bacterium]
MRTSTLLVGSLLLAGHNALAQPPAPFRLADAIAEADRHAFANRQAIADTDAERARAALPLKGVLPSARVEAGFVRTTDPIGAFGTLLRQRAVTLTAFDPARLNYPAPVDNIQGGVVLEMPVFNADALIGWQAARTAARASEAMADWTLHDVRFNVVRGYYGAILAASKVDLLLSAQRTAQSAVRQVERMVQQGLVTRADALQASVRAADVAAQLASARNDALTAQAQLALLLGRTSNTRTMTPIALPQSLPSDTTVRAFLRECCFGSVDSTVTSSVPFTSNDVRSAVRDDVRAAQLGIDAARLDARRAAASLLPRVNSFARYDWNSASSLYAGRPNWTVGVMASWSLFGGGSELADVAGATARSRMAVAGRDAAAAQARIEADQTWRGVQVARERLALTTLAATQSAEARRLIDKRYAGGLATVTELLGAETSATAADLQQTAARHDLIIALAAFLRATGADPGMLTRLADGSEAAPSPASTDFN